MRRGGARGNYAYSIRAACARGGAVPQRRSQERCSAPPSAAVSPRRSASTKVKFFFGAGRRRIAVYLNVWRGKIAFWRYFPIFSEIRQKFFVRKLVGALFGCSKFGERGFWEKKVLGIHPWGYFLRSMWTSDNDQSLDVECTGAELSHQALGTPQTLDLQTCYICQGTSDQESIMICDGHGCSVIAHLTCYFSAGSHDANDAITDIEHWHCENCGGLPRHMHPRPRAAKRARVSFDPLLSTPMATTSAQAVSTTHPSGDWGGHWPIRTAMPPTAKGIGKEAMEPRLPHWGVLPLRPLLESEQDPMQQAVRRKRPGSLSPAPTAATRPDMIRAKTRKVTGVDATHIDTSGSVMPSAAVSQTLAEQTPPVSRRGPRSRTHTGDYRRSGARAPSKTPAQNSAARAPVRQ